MTALGIALSGVPVMRSPFASSDVCEKKMSISVLVYSSCDRKRYCYHGIYVKTSQIEI